MHNVPRLQAGDRIALAAPSGPLDRSAFLAGAAVLRGWGLEIDPAPGLFARAGFLAGDDARRRAELVRALAAPQPRCLWFARGGYGIMRTLEQVTLTSPPGPTKLLIGFSDLTPLLNLVAVRFGWLALHGPTVAAVGDLDETSRTFLRALLCEPAPDVEVPADEVLRGGRVRAPLCGGNLSLLAHCLGTPLAVDPTGRVLLIEEVGEAPYRLDRLLTQLRLAGTLQRAAGIVVGHLSGAGGQDQDAALRAVARERLADLDVPVLLGLPVGHRPAHLALPIGAEVELDGDAACLRLVEPVVS